MILFGNKKLREENEKLKKRIEDDCEFLEELDKELDEMAVEKSKFESECERLRAKMKAMEEELDILRSEKARIDEKTRYENDKDAVITQLILEKDRLAIENIKYHADLIAEKEKSIELLRNAAYRGWNLVRR